MERSFLSGQRKIVEKVAGDVSVGAELASSPTFVGGFVPRHERATVLIWWCRGTWSTWRDLRGWKTVCSWEANAP